MTKTFGYLVGTLAILAPLATAQSAGSVYAQTNAPSGNSIVVLARAADGTLSAPTFFPTGGIGTGTGLGSQGSVAITNDGHWLLAVNAGSDDISIFSVRSNGNLILRSRSLSGGVRPTSLTVYGEFVFVLNAGDTPNITGFVLSRDGQLAPVPGGTTDLRGTGPAQVLFDDHGDLIVVTDRTSNQIEVFRLGESGKAEFLYIAPSAGRTPFGFAFAHNDVLVVSEAGTGSASSYKLSDQALTPMSEAVGNTQRAACWLVVTNNGKLAYVANAQSSSISSYTVAPGGALTLIDAIAGTTPTGTAPTDMALSRNSTFLYSVATGTISSFRISSNGALKNLGVISGLPATLVGLAAR